MKTLLLFALAAASLFAADATGKWTGTLQPSEGPAAPAVLVLKQDGIKLTGTAGPDAGDQRAIQNGKAENGNLSFEVASDGITMKFALKQTGEELKGDIAAEREGHKLTAKVSLAREK